MPSKKQEKPLDRLKKIALWQWGLIVIFAGIFSSMLSGTIAPTGGSSAAERGALVGRALAFLTFVLVGVVLIALHFVRRMRK